MIEMLDISRRGFFGAIAAFMASTPLLSSIGGEDRGALEWLQVSMLTVDPDRDLPVLLAEADALVEWEESEGLHSVGSAVEPMVKQEMRGNRRVTTRRSFKFPEMGAFTVTVDGMGRKRQPALRSGPDLYVAGRAVGS